LRATRRQQEGIPFLSDNGNPILDCEVPAIDHPEQLEQAIVGIPGVVGTGLFLGIAEIILIEDGQTVQVRQRRPR